MGKHSILLALILALVLTFTSCAFFIPSDNDSGNTVNEPENGENIGNDENTENNENPEVEGNPEDDKNDEIVYSEGLEFSSNGDGTCYLSSVGTCSDEVVIIPPTSPEGDRVTSIGFLEEDLFQGYAFFDCQTVKSVVIPNTVEIIGYEAFYMSSVESVTMPDSLKTIGSSAFYNCKNLTSIVIPNSVTSIGSGAFMSCENLISAVISDNITQISDLFMFCNNLVSVVIGSSVTDISGNSFNGCYRLVEVINRSSLDVVAGSENYGYLGHKAIEVHTGESKIVNENGYIFYTFEEVNYLVNYVGEEKDLVLPESYNGQSYEINEYAFAWNDDLTSVKLGEKVTSIGFCAFSDCKNISNITLNEEIEIIGEQAFGWCESLVSIVISNSVSTIGKTAFRKCTSLTTVVIGSGVKNIGMSVFHDCTNLTEIHYAGSETEWAEVDIGLFNDVLIDIIIDGNS